MQAVFGDALVAGSQSGVCLGGAISANDRKWIGGADPGMELTEQIEELGIDGLDLAVEGVAQKPVNGGQGMGNVGAGRAVLDFGFLPGVDIEEG